jgi:hypothetical protein
MATQAIRPVRSLGVGSHRPFDQWGTFLPEHTTAVSLLDRLLHHAVVVVTEGESFRMKEAKSRGDGPTAPVFAATNLASTQPTLGPFGGYSNPPSAQPRVAQVGQHPTARALHVREDVQIRPSSLDRFSWGRSCIRPVNTVMVTSNGSHIVRLCNRRWTTPASTPPALRWFRSRTSSTAHYTQ